MGRYDGDGLHCRRIFHRIWRPNDGLTERYQSGTPESGTSEVAGAAGCRISQKFFVFLDGAKWRGVLLLTYWFISWFINFWLICGWLLCGWLDDSRFFNWGWASPNQAMQKIKASFPRCTGHLRR